MKKVLAFSAWSLLLLVAVVSCKKDDPAPASNALIGNWKFTSAAATGCTDPTNNYLETCTLTADQCGTLAITATGWTFTITGSAAQTGTYTVSGSSITLAGGMTDTYTFAVVGTTLTFTEAPGADGCTHVSTFTKI